MKPPVVKKIVKHLKLPILFLCGFFVFETSAQYRVTKCSDLPNKPVIYGDDGPENLLAVYLEGDEDSDIGGLDCWAFHHENGKDYVVTPRSWYPDTGGPRMRLIEDAMAAITQSRRTYVEYGTMDKSLHYILNDVNYGTTSGEKFWLYQDDECWMRSGVPSLSEESRESRKQIFAHEIGHCFVEENVPKTASLEEDLDAWWDESVAEFLSSEAYKTADQEHRYAMAYDFNRLFTQPYRAYVLWYYYAKENGKASVVELMNALTGLKTIKARMNYLKSIGFDELFHNFLFDFTMRYLKDSGTSNPIPGSGMIPDSDFVLEPDKENISIPRGINFGQREVINIEVPTGFNVKLRPPIGSEGTFYSSLMPPMGGEIRNWDSPVELSGNCFSPMDVTVMISHLETEGIGDLTIPYELIAKADCCSGTEGTLDGCLIGTWEVDVSTISHLIDYDVSGTLRLKFDNLPIGHLNATFDLRFDFDNGDFDTHKGTVSACVIPTGRGGPLNYFKLSGVTLGPGNIHTHFYSRRGKYLDQTDNVIEGLNRFQFNYTTCTPDILTVLYMVQMSRVR